MSVEKSIFNETKHMFLVGKKQKHVFAAQKNHLIETALINNKKKMEMRFQTGSDKQRLIYRLKLYHINMVHLNTLNLFLLKNRSQTVTL